MPVKNALFLICLTLITLSVLAQQPGTPVYSNDKNVAKKQRINQMMKMEEEGNLIFNHYNLFGFKLATNGYGIFYERGKFITNTKSRIINIELNEINM